MNEDRSEEKFHDEGTIAMKELMLANIEQRKILSKMMDKYDSNRFDCIEKYFGTAFRFLDSFYVCTLHDTLVHCSTVLHRNV